MRQPTHIETTFSVERDGGTIPLALYALVSPRIEATYWSPAEGGEVTSLTAYTLDASIFELTDDERERAMEEILMVEAPDYTDTRE